jgi:hypothetical protein
VAIVADCIHAERAGGRLNPEWNLTGIASLIKGLGMNNAVLVSLES